MCHSKVNHSVGDLTVKNRFAASLAAVGMGLALSLPASAGISWFYPYTSFEDDNLDYFQDLYNAGGVACGGTTGVTCNGTLDVGDVFKSVAEWNTTFDPLTAGTDSSVAPAEVTAYAEARIKTLVDLGNGTANITLEANTADGLGVVVWLYEDPLTGGTTDLDVINSTCGTLAQCRAAAEDGNLLATAGFSGDLDEIWRITAVPLNPYFLLTVASGTATGSYQFGIAILQDNTGRNLAEQPCTPGLDCAGPLGGPALGDGMVYVVGSGSFVGGCGLPGSNPSGGTTPVCTLTGLTPNADGLFARSDTDFQVAPTKVPEPGTLGLLGLGVALLGLGARRRKA
jgi:hypothetical protein